MSLTVHRAGLALRRFTLLMKWGVD